MTRYLVIDADGRIERVERHSDLYVPEHPSHKGLSDRDLLNTQMAELLGNSVRFSERPLAFPEKGVTLAAGQALYANLPPKAAVSCVCVDRDDVDPQREVVGSEKFAFSAQLAGQYDLTLTNAFPFQDQIVRIVVTV